MCIYLNIFINVKIIYSMQNIIFVYVNIINIIFMRVSMCTDKHSCNDQQHHRQVGDGHSFTHCFKHRTAHRSLFRILRSGRIRPDRARVCLHQ